MRKMITITDGTETIRARVTSDADEPRRHLTIERDGSPVFGLEIGDDGSLVVGRWTSDGWWEVLHADVPEESPSTTKVCRCGHSEVDHDAKYSDPQCRLCPEDGERMWRHPFTEETG